MADPVVPTEQQLQRFASLPADKPVVMVNLLRYKRPGGKERYQQYALEVVPHLQRVGARPLYGADAAVTLIGEGEQPWWDAILFVEYPSPAAFQEMISDPGYIKTHEHREAALERGDLIATSVWGPAG